jgi:hypothetical protein
VPKIDTFAFGVKLHGAKKSTGAAVACDVKRHATDWSIEEIMALAFCTAIRRRMEKVRL